MRSVQDSTELRRVKALPRRSWSQDQAAAAVRALTEALRVPVLDLRPRPGGCRACGVQPAPPGHPGEPCRPMTLRPLQAIALAEIAQWGGILAGIPVGFGKTLVSGLAPRMVPGTTRPLVLVPAHLREKTEIELDHYRRHWVLPPTIRVISYQTLSVVKSASFLRDYAPDMIIPDEAHHLKTPGAGVTKRVARYVRERRAEGHRVTFCPMTGTLVGVSLRDFAHLANWALPRTNPLPEDFNTLQEWCDALDVDVPEHLRLDPGPLSVFLDPARPFESVTAAYGRRLAETPGVIMSAEPQLPIPIRVTSHAIEVDQVTADALTVLRAEGKTPDDQIAADGVQIWRHARELATGFYSIWDPRPPSDWREARRDWGSACREVLQTNRREIDTELALVNHLDRHPDHYPEAAEALEIWRQVEPTFTPNPVARWVSDGALKWIARWAAQAPGLIWVERPCVGARLAALGIPYYGEDGIDARTGRYVESHRSAEGSIALSIGANKSGRNLQYQWSRNLVVDISSSATTWEQMIGRTHRPGQPARVVTFDLLFGVAEDVAAFWKAHTRTIHARDMTNGQPQKLLDADLSGVATVEESAGWSGPQWALTRGRKRDKTGV